ncbi:MAG: hypothetical protein PF689_01020 [Deltaproteobacteria bacterium]|nr:hypothetical protein [Deltaproteobacteria bacterium]
MAIIFANLPLLNLMDYESTLLLAFFHSLAVVCLATRYTQKQKNNNYRLGEIWGHTVVNSLLLLAFPFVVMVISGLVNGQCNWLSGLKFFFFYPVLSGFFAASAGFAVGVYTRRWYWVAAAFFIPLFSLFVELFRLYIYPQIYAYDPFFGFYSGAFYDRLVEVGSAFYFARAYHLVMALIIVQGILFFKGKKRGKTDRFSILVLGTAFLFLFFTSARTGFRGDRNSIISSLGGKLETPNFIIYHSDEIKPKNVKFIALQAEFYRQELNRFFQNSYPGKVNIFLFDSIQQKRRLFGAHSVEVAKPWLSEIYITFRGLIHPSLKHELAHVWASMYGDDYFGISFTEVFGFIPLPNPGMIEGIAVAASFYSGGMSFHQKAKILHNLKIAIPVRKIFSPEFFASSSARAYTQAGSFLRYLYDQKGPEKLFELFANGGNFERVYDLSPEKLEEEYLNFLKTIKVDQEIMAVMKAVFSHPPVHKSRCVHQVAREVQKAKLAFGSKKFGKALKLFQKAIDYDPKSLYLKMYYLQAAKSGKYYKDAFAKAHQIIGSSNDNPQLKARAVLTMVEIYWFRKDISQARKTWQKLEALTLSRDLKRQKVLFKLILEMTSARRKLFRNIFLKPGKPVEIATKLEKTAAFFPLAKYLAASLLLNSGEWGEAAAVFRQVQPGTLPDSDFRCEFYRRSSIASLLVLNLKQARESLAKFQECPQSYSNLLNNRFLNYMEANRNNIKLQ